jgi:hypothetical protein
MAIINTNGGFGTSDTVNSTNLNAVADGATFNDPVDGTTLELITSGTDDGKLRIKTGGVGTNQIAVSAVTKAKIEDVANMKVLGNTSGAATAPQEVEVIDDDTMDTALATNLATAESIKAYVDSAPNFTPSTYAGEESVTLPNGLIMKFGTIVATKNTTTDVNFAVDFLNAAVSAQLTQEHTGDSDRFPLKIESLNTGTLTIRNTHGANVTAHWQVIGY